MDNLEYDAIFSFSGNLQQCTDTYNGVFPKYNISDHTKYNQECNDTFFKKRVSNQQVIASVKVRNDEGLYQELVVAMEMGEYR